MGNLLKFCKHRLPEQCGPELFQKIVHKIHGLLPVSGLFTLFHQIMNEQCLVAGRCHLCHEDPVACINIGLMFIRIPGMQSMPHLMGKCKDIVQCSLIVKQHVRMCSVGSPGIRTCPFSLILVDIYPSVIKSFSEQM